MSDENLGLFGTDMFVELMNGNTSCCNVLSDVSKERKDWFTGKSIRLITLLPNIVISY